ncbi:MAG: hypothetical protein ACPH79_08940 [Paracoccaceae bacterium]
MTQSNQTPDDELDDLFATARQAVPAPSAALVERIVDAAQQQSAVYSQPIKQSVALPWWRQLWRDIGGMPSLVGLTAAGIMGVWVGAFSSDISYSYLEMMSMQITGQDDFLDPFSGLDLTYLEG